MVLKVAAVIFGLAFASIMLRGQATPTERRAGDLQVGVNYGYVHPDYTPANSNSIGAYVDFDFRTHFGVEAEYRDASLNNSYKVKETNYLIGPRIFGHYHKLYPYGKVLVGRSSFYIIDAGKQNGSFNTVSFGGGFDFDLIRKVNLRLIDFEYQKWLSFPPHDLQPSVVSFGVAYHF